MLQGKVQIGKQGAVIGFAGACCVEAADATQGIRRRDETRGRIDGGWERHELLLKDSNWYRHANGLMWLAR